MEKRILLIGNDEGLPGVKVDIENYKNFFKSSIGGAWLDSELIPKLNVSRFDLLKEIQRLKLQSLDYLVVIFSGHGGQKRETVFELNPSGETLNESEIRHICNRQLNIFDCCRAYPQRLFEGTIYKAVSETLTDFTTRRKYENRILESIHQEVLLYACSIGEVANDTSQGGVYSKYLIQSSKPTNTKYRLVGSAHQAASVLVTNDFPNQHPDSVLPRCLSEQQLIIGINPEE